MTCLLPLACARAGLVHVPVNPLLKRAQVAHILADSGARLLISGKARLATLGRGRPARKAAPAVAEEEGAALLAGDDGLPPSGADPDELAALLYTSGSTGRPKGVMLSHANMWLGAVSVAHYLAPDAPRTGCSACCRSASTMARTSCSRPGRRGPASIPIDYLAARDVIRAVETHDITTLAGVPPLWVQLVEAAWPPKAALGAAGG